MLPKEKALTDFIERFGRVFEEEYVDRLQFLTTQALEERSMQGAKVAELQAFIERNFPESKEKNMHVVDLAKGLIATAYLLTPGKLQPEEVTVNQTLLNVLQEQFKCYYQGFEGTFEDWLELRGLEFIEDRFVPVDIGEKSQTDSERMLDVLNFLNDLGIKIYKI